MSKLAWWITFDKDCFDKNKMTFRINPIYLEWLKAKSFIKVLLKSLFE